MRVDLFEKKKKKKSERAENGLNEKIILSEKRSVKLTEKLTFF